MKNNLDLHFLVLKQFKRANLQEEDIPKHKSKEWYDFLSRVSRTYFDQEQERYLLERSMEISSKEMRELNEKLEFAQQIARLGYWQYDRAEDHIIWSKETFHLMGIDPSLGTPCLQEILAWIHDEDRPKQEVLLEQAFNEGKSYEIELRIKNQKDGKYYWRYIKGHPHIVQDENSNKINATKYLSGIIMDISDRKIAEDNLKNMHMQLLSTSRQAGMAEVATSVLHNIGNILNSSNISVSLLMESLSKSRINKLTKIAEMIKQHLDQNDGYLVNDQQGKLIPEYLQALSLDLLNEHKNIGVELQNIAVHLDHIKDVVSLQKNLIGISGVKEDIYLKDLVDLAIQMGCSPIESKEITIIKNYQYQGSIVSEKSKLLQIIVNLLRNARDAILAYHVLPKQIKIFIQKSDNQKSAEIIIQDNGSGITNENITRIFCLGFTTKVHGHGLGLHSSAIAAKELGGNLTVKSEGMGKGATFTLEIPFSCENKKGKIKELIKE